MWSSQLTLHGSYRDPRPEVYGSPGVWTCGWDGYTAPVWIGLADVLGGWGRVLRTLRRAWIVNIRHGLGEGKGEIV